MKSSLIRLVPVAAAVALCCSSVGAATVTWVGPADSFWDVPANWSPGLPADGDDIVLGAFSTQYRAFPVMNVGSLSGTGVLTVQNATLVSANASSIGGLVLVDAGMVGGTGSLNVNGPLNWVSGGFTGTGSATIVGDATIAGPSLRTIETGPVTFAGTTTWTNAPIVNGGNGGIFVGNTSLINTGTWLDQIAYGSTIARQGSASFATFSNEGTYAKSGNSGVNIATTFNNSGTLSVQAGELRLSGGGSSTGLFDVGAGATLVLTGGHTLSNVSSGTGTGTGVMTASADTVTTVGGFSVAASVGASGGIFNFNGPSTAGGLVFSAGYIGGTGSLTVNGPMTWTQGEFRGTGATTINGDATISSGDFHTIDTRTVTFTGTTTRTNTATGNGHVWLSNGGSLVNTGTWLDQAAFSSSFDSSGTGASSFTNQGTYIKSGNNTTTISVAFFNPGRIDIQSGTLKLPSPINSPFTNTGTIGGNGTVEVDRLYNDGHLTPGDSAGTLTVLGNLVQTASGWLDIELTTAGVHDLLRVSGDFVGNATLDGTLNIACLGVCSFAIGDSLTILNASNLYGTFANVAYTGFAPGTFDVIYDRAAGDVRLVALMSVSAVPEPGTYAMMALGLLGISGSVRRRMR